MTYISQTAILLEGCELVLLARPFSNWPIAGNEFPQTQLWKIFAFFLPSFLFLFSKYKRLKCMTSNSAFPHLVFFQKSGSVQLTLSLRTQYHSFLGFWTNIVMFLGKYGEKERRSIKYRKRNKRIEKIRKCSLFPSKDDMPLK